MYIIYGTGGHAKVVWDALRTSLERDFGYILFVDDQKIGRRFLTGTIQDPRRVQDNCSVVVAIGDNYARRRIVEKLEFKYSFLYFPPVHHISACLPTYEVADVYPKSISPNGCHFLANSSLGIGSHLGKFCIINTGASVDHDCELGDFVHIAPGTRLCGSVSVGENTMVGAGSVVIPGIRIGKDSVIGAGSVVVEDIPDGVIAFGNPCRVRKERDV